MSKPVRSATTLPFAALSPEDAKALDVLVTERPVGWAKKVADQVFADIQVHQMADNFAKADVLIEWLNEIANS